MTQPASQSPDPDTPAWFEKTLLEKSWLKKKSWRPWLRELRANAHIGLVNSGNLGDVVATLPMAGAIKAAWPKCELIFVGRRYTEPLVRASRHVGSFVDAALAGDDVDVIAAERLDVLLISPPFNHAIAQNAARAGVPVRIGNLRRPSTLRWCNRFVFYGRARTGLQEAALNLRDLRALGLWLEPSIAEMAALAGVTRIEPLAAENRALLKPGRFHLVLQTKTTGHAREWPLEYFLALTRMLPADRVQIILSGTAAEGDVVRAACPELLAEPNVTNAFGRFSLTQLMAFVAAADGLVAASTGPLHLAAVLGIHALGIFPARDSIGGKRWFPLGPKGEALQVVESCAGDAQCDFSDGAPCRCTISVTPRLVYERVMAWVDRRTPPPAARSDAHWRARVFAQAGVV